MDCPFLVCSGYHATPANAAQRQAFADLWFRNTPWDCLIVDVGPVPLVVPPGRANVRVIRTTNALGHAWHDFRRKPDPQFGGWSVSWLAAGWIAYGERKDLLFKEQDCLTFGPWYRQLMADREEFQADVLYGMGCKRLKCEQSLFWVRWSAIPRFLSAYGGLPEGDGVLLPEDKFIRITQLPDNPCRASFFNLPGGRQRSLPYAAKAWYAQQFTEEELAATLARFNVDADPGV